MIWHSVLIDNLCWSVEVHFWRLPARARWSNFKLIRPNSTLGIDSHCGLRRHFFIVDLIGDSLFNRLLGNGWSYLNETKGRPPYNFNSDPALKNTCAMARNFCKYSHSWFRPILVKICFILWAIFPLLRNFWKLQGLNQKSTWFTPITPIFLQRGPKMGQKI